MKSRRLLFLTLLVFSGVFFSEETAFSKTEIDFDLGIDLGSRMDHLDFNIAGNVNGLNPNVLSELTWDEMEIEQIKGEGHLVIGLDKMPFSLYARGDLAYGGIVKGLNQDSDYAGDNRTSEFSRSNNNGGEGSVKDKAFGFGVQFKIKIGTRKGAVKISPLIGYSIHEQNLRMVDGKQTLSEASLVPADVDISLPAIGPFAGLNSTYSSQWKGPWVGIDISINPPKHVFDFLFEYHKANYSAEADWNLRTDLFHPISFVHEAKGTGYIASMGWQYFFLREWAISLGFDAQKWSTDAGSQTSILSDESTVRTRLNQVNWDSKVYSLGLKYRFQ